MKCNLESAEIFVPDGLEPEEALVRTTHMGIAAHPDDLEIMAFDGILGCFPREDRWFCGAVATSGSGSPKDDLYRDFSDREMQAIRRKDQRKAAADVASGVSLALDLTPPMADPARSVEADVGEFARRFIQDVEARLTWLQAHEP